jgi:hypothetical protein
MDTRTNVLARFRTFICLALFAFSGVAAAQRGSSSIAPGEVAAPIELVMEVINGKVRCSPPRARLPALDYIALRVLNRAERPVMFVAPEFFRAADSIESSGFALDVAEGGFLAAPQSTVQAVLRTPKAGEYYYSCYEPGQVPTPQSSGFLIVVPAAR